MKDGEVSVQKLIVNWFEHLKKFMFLTGSKYLNELKNNKLIKKEELF